MIAQKHGNWQKYQNRNPVQRALISRFLNEIKSLILPLPGRSILDAGCGEGFVLNALLQMRSDLELAVGTDIDCDALHRGRDLVSGVQLIRADVLHLPYAANSFDIVLCTEVLEHLKNPEMALSELGRVCGSYCLLSVPHEPFFRLSNLLRGKNIRRLGNDIDHYQTWSHTGFVQFVAEHLDILVVKRSFPWQIVLGQVR